jgi:ketosteroid isomerase-like protein
MRVNLPTRRSGILAGVSRPDYYGNPSGHGDVDVVRAIYAAFARRDVEAALTHIAADCELHVEGTSSAAGRAGPYRGHDGVREYFADVGRVWDHLELHADDFRSLPGSVIVIGHVDAVRGGEKLRRAAVWTWRVAGGKATYARVSDLGDLE